MNENSGLRTLGSWNLKLRGIQIRTARSMLVKCEFLTCGMFNVAVSNKLYSVIREVFRKSLISQCYISA
jgi:hypothetical protein